MRKTTSILWSIFLVTFITSCNLPKNNALETQNLTFNVKYQNKNLSTSQMYAVKNWINLETSNVFQVETSNNLELKEFVNHVQFGDTARINGLSISEKIELEILKPDTYQSKSFLTQNSFINQYSTMNAEQWDDIFYSSNQPNPLGYKTYLEENQVLETPEIYEKYLEYTRSYEWKNRQKVYHQEHKIEQKSDIWWDVHNNFATLLNDKQKTIFQEFAASNNQKDTNNQYPMDVALALIDTGAFKIKRINPKMFELTINPLAKWKLANNETKWYGALHWGFYFNLTAHITGNELGVASYTSPSLVPYLSQAKYSPKIKQYLESRK